MHGIIVSLTHRGGSSFLFIDCRLVRLQSSGHGPSVGSVRCPYTIKRSPPASMRRGREACTVHI